jgi:quercetin dioxygenase-like cupin family protein
MLNENPAIGPRETILHVLLVMLTSSACTSQGAHAQETRHMVVSRADERPSMKGPASAFIGSVTVTPLFSPKDGLHAEAALVTFEPGARSAWHTHPAGQTLIVVDGTGWLQEVDGKKIEIQKGDVIWTPPGLKHWHGGTATTSLTHITVQEAVDGRVVDWKEAVSDEQYAR